MNLDSRDLLRLLVFTMDLLQQMTFYRVFLMLSWGSFRYINPYSGEIPFLRECVSRQDKFRSYLDYLNIFSLVCKQ